jgi:ubiquinone biosynthesis protein UbiJ
MQVKKRRKTILPPSPDELRPKKDLKLDRQPGRKRKYSSKAHVNLHSPVNRRPVGDNNVDSGIHGHGDPIETESRTAESIQNASSILTDDQCMIPAANQREEEEMVKLKANKDALEEETNITSSIEKSSMIRRLYDAQKLETTILAEEKAQLQDQVERLQNTLSIMESQMNASSVEAKKLYDSEQERAARLAEENAQLQDQVERLQNTVSNMESQMNASSVEAKKLYDSEQERAARLAEENAQLQGDVERLQNTLSIMESQIYALSEQLNGANELYDIEQDKTTWLSEEKTQLDGKVERLQNTVSNMELQMNASSVEAKKLYDREQERAAREIQETIQKAAFVRTYSDYK